MKDAEAILDKLNVESLALGDGVYIVARGILEDPRFVLWSGASREYQHHYGKGGLINHTSEVIDLCMINREYYVDEYKIDKKALFLAALFHDVGKMFDYEPVPNVIDGDESMGQWKSTEHKRLIHHISRSALMWSENAKKSQSICAEYHDEVLHAVLSHHGQRKYGSPVAPKGRLATLVHLCDGISARMYDADTLDIINREQRS